MIEFIAITTAALFINISGVKAATDSNVNSARLRPIITIEDVSNNKPLSLIEALQQN